MEEKKIFSNEEFEELISNMKIIDHGGYFDGISIFVLYEAKKDNKSLWFIGCYFPNKKPKYLMVHEQNVEWIKELMKTDKERLSSALYGLRCF